MATDVWGSRHSPADGRATLHGLYEAQAARRPEAVALTCAGQSLTYEQLNAQANRLARELVKCGVKPDMLVGLSVDRSNELVIAILAILKAGGAYLPIDLAYPADRVAFMLEDAQVPVLLTQRNLIDSLPSTRAKVLCMDEVLGRPAQAAETANLSLAASPDQLAYVIYTSGTTGRPKGSLITHRNVARLFPATESWYGFDERDVWTLFHSCAFDFSVWEIWGALLYGGRVVVVPFMVSRSPEAFYELLASERVTVLNQTPSAFRQLLQAEESLGQKELALRYVIFGGEALDMQSLGPWFERHGDQKPRLVNMYGITETTVHVTYRPLSKDDLHAGSAIGVPIPDLEIYILDAQRQPVPVGVPGEMYVGGAGLARGYLNRPELTAERFIPDHVTGRPGSRLYKTGDLARYLPGPDIEYLGRIDDQVKIRGFRVELGEIESVLRQHPAVREATVIAREDAPNAKRLVAYLVTSAPAPKVSSLREHLEKKLPEYMVPAAYVFLEALPLTASGKIDRKALPVPERQRPELAEGLALPRTELERRLARMWCKTLLLDEIGIHDRFFELGGDSIHAAMFVNSLQGNLGEFIYTVTIFKSPTVAQYASFLQRDYGTAVAKWLGTSVGPEKDLRNGKPDLAARSRTDRLTIEELQQLVPLLPWSPETADSSMKKNRRMIFLLGAPRSGTTLLRVMLAGHPALFSATELQLLCFHTLGERGAAFRGRFSAWLEGSLRAIMELKQCGPEEAKQIMRGYEERNYTTKDFYKVLQDWAGDRLLLDKSPHYALDPGALRKAERDFDSPFYIHLFRHPLAMVESFEKQHMEQVLYLKEHDFSSRQLGEAIWTLSNKNILDFLEEVPRERQFVIQFEELTRRPSEVMTALCDAMGVGFHPDVLQPYKDQERKMVDGLYAVSQSMSDQNFRRRESIDPRIADGWKEESEADSLGEVTWQVARSLGYARPDALRAIDDDRSLIEKQTTVQDRNKERQHRRERRTENRTN
jgi:amino acid adenylation domain-containing protein